MFPSPYYIHKQKSDTNVNILNKKLFLMTKQFDGNTKDTKGDIKR